MTLDNSDLKSMLLKTHTKSESIVYDIDFVESEKSYN